MPCCWHSKSLKFIEGPLVTMQEYERKIKSDYSRERTIKRWHFSWTFKNLIDTQKARNWRELISENEGPHSIFEPLLSSNIDLELRIR